ncbi:monovalent cation:proton antiporter-2 (CPA2) family protein [Thiohalomonas denitrificans]|uniref:Kef-type potassium/proton antiporter, CPA2 family n=1 Tax=Thiohalomonas denitrificans TaxID=415747 RepID=A0A1G5Q7A7_9GAMM|nr:monovalent cation:proton antiporter-2 (CPA2) family protein [Thiohalomonas denitrificans]SCZ57508.1 Kef-type potassium/proton antiporter, CPA2 family [Thiohalomonas denitrificans]
MTEAGDTQIVIPYLQETVAFLLTVVVVVPLCRAVKVSPILGFLAVGAAIGPFGLAIVGDVEGVRHFAELGVVFLLFMIGLELSFERLKAFSGLIFGLGAAQVLVTAALISLIAFGWGNSIEASIIIGLCLALSSTAMVMQLLNERGEMSATHGRASFAVLLFQDLAVVPILILVAALGADGGNVWGEVVMALLRAAVAVVAIVVIGRYVLRYLFRTVARTRSVDVFTAMTLLAILATSLVTGYAGLSMALGAFLAGLLLAETEFRHQVESEIEPFKGILLGLFFMSVGMSIDFLLVADQAFWVALAVIGLILLKSAVIYLLGMAFGLPRHDAARSGLLLGEAGEFAFVVIGAALVSQLMPEKTGQFMLIVAALSMALTPLLAVVAARVGRALQPVEGGIDANEAEVADLKEHVVLAGYGRIGQTVAAVLRRQAIPYVALDLNSGRVRRCRDASEPVYYGDATRTEVLRRAGADRAKVMLVTMDDASAAARTVQAARQLWPDLKILVRARDNEHSGNLCAIGADAVVPETLEASLQLAGHVLRSLGNTPDMVNDCIEKIREHEYAPVCQLVPKEPDPNEA